MKTKKEKDLPAALTFQVMSVTDDGTRPIMIDNRVATVSAYTPRSARLQARQRHGDAVQVQLSA